jgi:transcriptional regulator with XRE-family HTH domain
MTEWDRVEAELVRRGLTLAEFARQLKVRSQHVNNWKNRGIPKGKLVAVAQVLGLTVDQLLGVPLRHQAPASAIQEPRDRYVVTRELLDKIGQLTNSQQQELIARADDLAHKNRELLDELLQTRRDRDDCDKGETCETNTGKRGAASEPPP